MRRTIPLVLALLLVVSHQALADEGNSQLIVPVVDDNLPWTPPAGHLPVGQLLDLDWDIGDVRTQAAEPGTQENLRRVGLVCSQEPEEYERYIAVRACFYLWKLDGESDTEANYFWEEFIVSATGRYETNVSRVQGQNASPNGENVRWEPTGDRDFGSPKTETYTLGFSVTGTNGSVNGSLSRSTPIFPGRIHPFPRERIFHSSWITNDDEGAEPDKTIDSLGMNVWRVPESAGGIKTRVAWNVWCQC